MVIRKLKRFVIVEVVTVKITAHFKEMFIKNAQFSGMYYVVIKLTIARCISSSGDCLLKFIEVMHSRCPAVNVCVET